MSKPALCWNKKRFSLIFLTLPVFLAASLGFITTVLAIATTTFHSLDLLKDHLRRSLLSGKSETTYTLFYSARYTFPTFWGDPFFLYQEWSASAWPQFMTSRTLLIRVALKLFSLYSQDVKLNSQYELSISIHAVTNSHLGCVLTHTLNHILLTLY